MKKFLEIKPEKGLGDFNFGMHIKEVTEFFGEPDETEILNDEDFETRINSYWEKGLTFFFEGDGNSVLACIETDNEDVTLYGRKIIGATEAEVVALMAENGYKDWEEENEEWGEKRITFEDIALDFYFENDELISVSWATLEDY